MQKVKSKEYVQAVVAVVIGAMFSMMLVSAKGDSATMDELAHIPAGYSYATLHDFRLNPEHPPIVKVLSGYSAKIFAKANFPTDNIYWRDYVNGQWDQGRVFLYESGNDADKIIFWSRLPVIILTVLLGAFLFWWTRKRFGEGTALLTLILYAFSPTILAHGRLVTTDVGAALGFFIGIAAFIKFLEKTSRANLVLWGLALGFAQLFKFSLVLLIPVYLVVILARSWTEPRLELGQRFKKFFALLGKTFLAGAVGLILIWGVYYAFNYNQPQAKQIADAEYILQSHPTKSLAQFNIWLMKNEYTRHLGQYFLGFLMVSQRAEGGNTGYFLGEVSNTGWSYYFPVVYLTKETLALHLLTLIALFFGISKIVKNKGGKISHRIRGWIYEHPIEFSSLVFIAIYWGSSMASPLNIGVRHVLPTFPFIYLLVSKQVVSWLKHKKSGEAANGLDILKNIYQIYIKSLPRYFLVLVLVFWIISDTVSAAPHFLSYYNELGGGIKNGYKIAADSNYDWGQDLKRLQKFVEKNKIEKVAIDYFGGGNPRYYLGDKFESWWSSKGMPPSGSWLAVSSSFYQVSTGRPVRGFEQKPEDTYAWLKQYEPAVRAGYSIFIYKMP